MTVQELVSKMLLLEYGDGSVDLHDMIKDAVRPTINSKDLNRYETVAYLYYSKRGGDQDLLLALDLAYRLRRMDDLVSLISDHGEYLIGKGYHFIEGLVDELEGEVHDPSTQILLLLISSDRSMSRSDFDWAVSLIRDLSLVGRAELLISPVLPGLRLPEVADWIMAAALPLRLHLQLHKLIWTHPGVDK